MSLAETIAANRFGYCPMPYEKDFDSFRKLVNEIRSELSGMESTAIVTFNQCKGKAIRKSRVRIPSKQQFISQF